MKSVRLWIIVAAITAISAAAFAADVTDEQQPKLAEIEKYIAGQRQSVEDYFTARLETTGEKLRSIAASLSAGDNHKRLTAGFLGWSIYVQEVLLRNGVDLSKDREYAAIMSEYRGHRLADRQKLNLSPRLLAIAECRLAEEQFRLEQRLAMDKLRTERQRRYAIDVQLPDLEAKLKDNVLNPRKSAPEDMVTGIVYSQDKPAAVVGGKIVHKGDEIGKVRVVGISPDEVQFEKAGRQWTQKVGEEGK
jgi:hypothetical protein